MESEKCYDKECTNLSPISSNCHSLPVQVSKSHLPIYIETTPESTHDILPLNDKRFREEMDKNSFFGVNSGLNSFHPVVFEPCLYYFQNKSKTLVKRDCVRLTERNIKYPLCLSAWGRIMAFAD